MILNRPTAWRRRKKARGHNSEQAYSMEEKKEGQRP
jgi:hypothetical protein